MSERVAIVFDGEYWFLRRIRVIEYDLDLDEKVYRCDRPLGGPCKTFKEIAAVLREHMEPTIQPHNERGE